MALGASLLLVETPQLRSTSVHQGWSRPWYAIRHDLASIISRACQRPGRKPRVLAPPASPGHPGGGPFRRPDHHRRPPATLAPQNGAPWSPVPHPACQPAADAAGGRGRRHPAVAWRPGAGRSGCACDLLAGQQRGPVHGVRAPSNQSTVAGVAVRRRSRPRHPPGRFPRGSLEMYATPRPHRLPAWPTSWSPHSATSLATWWSLRAWSRGLTAGRAAVGLISRRSTSWPSTTGHRGCRGSGQTSRARHVTVGASRAGRATTCYAPGTIDAAKSYRLARAGPRRRRADGGALRPAGTGGRMRRRAGPGGLFRGSSLPPRPAAPVPSGSPAAGSPSPAAPASGPSGDGDPRPARRAAQDRGRTEPGPARRGLRHWPAVLPGHHREGPDDRDRRPVRLADDRPRPGRL